MKSQKDIEWTKLDNASRIFPSTYSEKDPKVFRLSCELNEVVDSIILQEALDITMKNHPLFYSVMRRGIFWYYLERSEIHPRVEIESQPLCSLVYLGHKRNLLFRVFYFNKRINLELFHALSDGTGAFHFFQILVNNYLLIRYKEEFVNEKLSLNKAAISMQMADGFEKYFDGGYPYKLNFIRKKEVSIKKAYHIKGDRIVGNQTRLIEGVVSTETIKKQAHDHHTTLTRFITALYIFSIYKEMPTRKLKYPIVLSIPINLRQFFNSETIRNFFSTINISYNFNSSSSELPDVIKAIDEKFQKELAIEQLNYKLNRFMYLAQNPIIRLLPLQLKNIFLRIASYFNYRQLTSGISNVGQIYMPEVFASYIRQFGVCTRSKDMRLTLCSYQDKLVFSFSSPWQETDIQRTFFRLLVEMGIDVEISHNI